MTRRLLVAFVITLLLSLQQETLFHALAHDSARIAADAKAGLHQAAPDGPCALCTLLAGGRDAVASHAAHSAITPQHSASVPLAPTGVPTAAPVHYVARGPPPLS
jgi:hypothetical protein